MNTPTDPDPPFRPCGLITLTTDFGTTDGYVGAMKGRILNHASHLRIEDLAHEIPPQNVIHGASTLLAAAPYWPSGTVHIVVVDPGVGTTREPLAAIAGGQCFVAPNNGVLVPVLELLGGAVCREIRRNRETEAFLPAALAPTFHGRDLFTPIGAALASGALALSLTGPLCYLQPLPLAKPSRVGSSLEGEILLFDHFGNAITNLREEDLPQGSPLQVSAGGCSLFLHKTYGEVAQGAPLALIGSSGYLEIAVRDGHAGQILGLRIADRVQIED